MLTKTEIAARLETTCSDLCAYVQALSPDRFAQQPAEEWSGAGYLEHLILSVKATAKGFQTAPEALERLFGRAAAPSRSYDALTTFYQAGLAAGANAPANITPVNYRIPDEVTDLKTYLLGEWIKGNERLITALDNWPEADLDAYVLPHPLMSNLTLREMLYFTLHHNQHHLGDIQRVTGSDWQ